MRLAFQSPPPYDREALPNRTSGARRVAHEVRHTGSAVLQGPESANGFGLELDRKVVT
jgi:hypothetical protein